MSEWQPIETAPQDWEAVLVWAITENERDDAEDEEREPQHMAVVAMHSDIQPGLWWMRGTLARVYNPTHWMPLPHNPHGSTRLGKE